MNLILFRHFPHNLLTNFLIFMLLYSLLSDDIRVLNKSNSMMICFIPGKRFQENEYFPLFKSSVEPGTAAFTEINIFNNIKI